MSGCLYPRATAEYLQRTLGHCKAAAEKGESGLHVFATYLFTHNSQVSILSFALGFAFGVPTMMLEYYQRSEEHTSELQSLMRISYAVFCLKKKKQNNTAIKIDRKNKDIMNLPWITQDKYTTHTTAHI